MKIEIKIADDLWVEVLGLTFDETKALTGFARGVRVVDHTGLVVREWHEVGDTHSDLDDRCSR